MVIKFLRPHGNGSGVYTHYNRSRFSFVFDDNGREERYHVSLYCNLNDPKVAAQFQPDKFSAKIQKHLKDKEYQNIEDLLRVVREYIIHYKTSFNKALPVPFAQMVRRQGKGALRIRQSNLYQIDGRWYVDCQAFKGEEYVFGVRVALGLRTLSDEQQADLKSSVKGVLGMLDGEELTADYIRETLKDIIREFKDEYGLPEKEGATYKNPKRLFPEIASKTHKVGQLKILGPYISKPKGAPTCKFRITSLDNKEITSIHRQLNLEPDHFNAANSQKKAILIEQWIRQKIQSFYNDEELLDEDTALSSDQIEKLKKALRQEIMRPVHNAAR